MKWSIIFIKNLLVVLSAIMSLVNLFKKKPTPIEIKKEQEELKDDIKTGDLDELNEKAGWK